MKKSQHWSEEIWALWPSPIPPTDTAFLDTWNKPPEWSPRYLETTLRNFQPKRLR